MTGIEEKIAYHKAAGQFLKTYYDNNEADNIFFSYGFLIETATEAKNIAKSLALKGMDYQDAIVSAWFSFAVVTDICTETSTTSIYLLNEFFGTVNYPEANRVIIEAALKTYTTNSYPDSKIQKVISDAINSRLARSNFLENILLLKEEMNRIGGTDKPELDFLNYYRQVFLKKRYYTMYAEENYSAQRERNFQLLEKRIHKLEATENTIALGKDQAVNEQPLSSKETEDLFKIAFRNYNQLVSVADSKASLLINVNSIIISVMIAFVLSKVERSMSLLWPTVLLLIVCMTTILLSILASRPQKNSFLGDENSGSYQQFFFGSFDLIDHSFRSANWESYYSRLNVLFNSSKEQVYMEIYKESFNVRKVLSKKFTYLSAAYTVFILGLLAAILFFVITIQSHPVTA